MSGWWRGKRALVTGGAGFIGSNLVARLLAESAQVRVVDNLERGKLMYLGENLGRVEFLKEDLRQPQVASRGCEGVEVVFHLASKVGGIGYYLKRAGEVFRENTLIDHNVCSAALEQGVPYYLYASSAHVYPIGLQRAANAPPIREEQAYPAAPELSYGWAKLLGEKLIECTLSDGHPIRAAIPRIVGAYGPHQDIELASGSAIPVFIRRALEYPRGKPFVVRGTGRETRSYCYVDDVVEALLLSVEKLTEQTLVGPVNIGSGGLISIAELARTVTRLSGKQVEITYDPSEPTRIWGQAVDCSYAHRLLGWSAKVSLENGLRASFRDIAKRLPGPEGG